MMMALALDVCDFGTDADSRQDVESSGSPSKPFLDHPIVCEKQGAGRELHGRPRALVGCRRIRERQRQKRDQYGCGFLRSLHSY